MVPFTEGITEYVDVYSSGGFGCLIGYDIDKNISL
jgi:hypothetical protein